MFYTSDYDICPAIRNSLMEFLTWKRSHISHKTSWRQGKDERQLYLRAKDTVLCLQPEGVLPMMAYMRKFHTKGVLFSGFRYMKGRDLGILSLRSVAETPTSGDLKSGESLFFTTPPPEFQQTPPPTPPDKLTQPPMRMTLDIA